ncbi:MAG: ABC transporter substrate-binding protein [Deltaproteobacteria bacterium]|nr:ABC transporter substrate-binding protein [Deltaproteobacteria bacterium]
MFTLFIQPCFGLSIGTVEEPPGNFRDKNGKVTGISVDFVKEIQKRVNNKSHILILPGPRLIYNSIKEKNYVIFSLSRTKARENKYHWISLVMRKPLVMFAKKGSNHNVKNLRDAKKVISVGVMRSSVQHNFLSENNFKNIYPVANHIQNLKKLMAGRVTLMYHSMQGAAILCKDAGVDFNQLEPVLYPQISKSSIAMSKNSDIEIVRKWQKAAKDIKADGTFYKIAMKWLIYTEKNYGIKAEIKDGALNFWKEK